MDPKPSLPPRKKAEKSALLQAAFRFDDVNYLVALSAKGLSWTRSNGIRNHFVSFQEMICVHRKKTLNGGFTIVAAVPKGQNDGFFKLGPTKERLVTFDPLKRGPQEDAEIDLWISKISENIQLSRNIPPNKKLLVFVNPFSGPGKAADIWQSLLPLFKISEVPFEVISTKKQWHAHEHCQSLDISQYYAIVTVSGDGLLNEVINGIMLRPDWSEAVQALTFGIIPGGSGNGLAGSLGIEEPFRAAVAIITNQRHPLDLFQIEQKGKLTYGFMGIEWSNLAVIDLDSDDMRWMGPTRFDLKGIAVALEACTHSGKLSFVSEDFNPSKPTFEREQERFPEPFDPSKAENCRTIEDNFSIFYAGNVTKLMISEGHFVPHALLSDGHLDIVFARNLGSVDLGLLLTDVENGKFVQSQHVEYYKTKAFELIPAPSSTAPIGSDGERIENCPTRVQVLKAFLNVFHDPKNLIEKK